MGAPGLHRSVLWRGAPRFRQDRRPHYWSTKDLHAGEEMSKGITCGQYTFTVSVLHVSMEIHTVESGMLAWSIEPRLKPVLGVSLILHIVSLLAS